MFILRFKCTGLQHFYDGGPYNMETSPLICQISGLILYDRDPVMKEFNVILFREFEVNSTVASLFAKDY